VWVIWQPLEDQSDRDHGPFTPTPVITIFCQRGLGDWKVFTLAVPLRSGQAEFLRGREVGKTYEWDARYLDTYSTGALRVFSS
jgi:hypothetical protein